MSTLANMPIARKFMIVYVLFVIPVGYLLWSNITERQAAIAFSAKERLGTAYMNALRPALFHAARALAEIDGGDGAKLTEAAAALEKLDGQLGQALSSQTAAALATSAMRGTRNPDSTVVMMTALTDLTGVVADGSNITLDPDIDSFYQGDTTFVKLPSVLALFGQMGRAAKSAAIDPKAKTDLLIYNAQLKALLDGLEANGKKSIAGNVDGLTEKNVGPVYSAAIASMREALTVIETAAQMGRADTAALARGIQEADKLMAAANAETDRLLVARISGFEARMWSMLVLTTVLTAFALGLLLIISRQIAGPVRDLTDTMGRLASDELDVTIQGTSRGDEIGAMARAISVFKENALEKRRLTQEQVRRDEADRQAARQAAEKEAAVQAEIAVLVQAARDGDFSQRLDLSGKQGFMLSLATDMNKLVATVEAGLNEAVSVMTAMASGNLSKRITGEYRGIFAKLKADSNSMADKLSAIVRQISSTAASVDHAAREIAAGSSDLAARTEQQASSLEETAASMEELTATVRQNADNSKQASVMGHQLRDSAIQGGEVVGKAVDAMQKIEASSAQISEIVSMIQEIAFQTNLLALNAAVEAARAGDAGKGFAVVAAEVRNLAQRANQASKDIKSLIATSDSQVRDGVALVSQTGKTLTEFVTAVKRVSDIVAEISAASSEQATGVEEINTAVMNMDDMTQRNGALVEETTAAAQSLSHQASDLVKLVGFFQVDGHSTAIAAEPDPAPTHLRQAPTESRPASAPVLAQSSGEDDDDWKEF